MFSFYWWSRWRAPWCQASKEETPIPSQQVQHLKLWVWAFLDLKQYFGSLHSYRKNYDYCIVFQSFLMLFVWPRPPVVVSSRSSQRPKPAASARNGRNTPARGRKEGGFRSGGGGGSGFSYHLLRFSFSFLRFSFSFLLKATKRGWSDPLLGVGSLGVDLVSLSHARKSPPAPEKVFWYSVRLSHSVRFDQEVALQLSLSFGVMYHFIKTWLKHVQTTFEDPKWLLSQRGCQGFTAIDAEKWKEICPRELLTGHVWHFYTSFCQGKGILN